MEGNRLVKGTKTKIIRGTTTDKKNKIQFLSNFDCQNDISVYPEMCSESLGIGVVWQLSKLVSHKE